jgi:NO-binding membrane sensor protein with MHYT domain
MPLGDVSRAAGGSFTIELLLIALVTFHASSSVAVWILERTRAGTRHRLAFVASVALAVGVAVLHLVWLRARP